MSRSCFHWAHMRSGYPGALVIHHPVCVCVCCVCVCVCVCVPGAFLDSSSSLLAVAACTALGEVGRNGSLLVAAEGEGFTKLSTVENLLARIPSGKENLKVCVCVCARANPSSDFPLFSSSAKFVCQSMLLIITALKHS